VIERMSLQPIDTHAFIIQCIENARESLTLEKEDLSDASILHEQDSILVHYMETDKYDTNEFSTPYTDNNTLSTQSLASDDEQYNIDLMEVEDPSSNYNPEYNAIEEMNNTNTPAESDEQDSIAFHYYADETDTQLGQFCDLSEMTFQDNLSVSTPSLTTEPDEDSFSSETHSVTDETNGLSSLDPSHVSKRSNYTQETPVNGDNIPKSFLQLQGITIGNYNMACNFHVSAALKIMAHYKLHI
jgi:hypothetical protein